MGTNWLNEEDVRKNFVALFVIDYKEENLYERIVGVWKTTNQPQIIQCESPYHYVPRYSFVKKLTFAQVRAYAQQSAGTKSVFAEYFFEVNHSNWMDLLQKAMLAVHNRFVELVGTQAGEFNFQEKESRLYNYMSNNDIFFHSNSSATEF